MSSIINDMVIRFANVNGTGSASANNMFSKAIFRMGLPVSPKNIFPSNIQGLPTWYEVRINESGYLGRRAGIDILVAVNPQSFQKDIAAVRAGGYFIYDNTKPLHREGLRDDIHYLGISMMQLSMDFFTVPRQQQLFKNIIYVGALAALINMDMEVIRQIIREQFSRKPKLVPPNFQALDVGYNYAKETFSCPLPLHLESRDKVGDHIMMEGNAATALGAIYAGATVAAWYPITPSTSVVKNFEAYAKKLRIDPETGKKNYAIVQGNGHWCQLEWRTLLYRHEWAGRIADERIYWSGVLCRNTCGAGQCAARRTVDGDANPHPTGGSTVECLRFARRYQAHPTFPQHPYRVL